MTQSLFVKTYTVTDKATEWVCGRRVAEDGSVRLTNAQAEGALARGLIALPEPLPPQPSRSKGKGE